MAELVVSVIGSDLPPRSIALNGAMSVGRSEQCDLSIDDRHLSREHCRIEPLPNESGWVVLDCKSTNGTRIGAERIERHRLVNGDVIIAGPMRIEFRDDALFPIPDESAALAPLDGKAKSAKQLGNETILDGIIATGQTSGARFPATARRSPPRLRPALMKSAAVGRRGKSTSISISDLLRNEPEKEPVPAKVEPTVTGNKNDAEDSPPFASDESGWRSWWMAATEFFRRRLL